MNSVKSAVHIVSLSGTSFLLTGLASPLQIDVLSASVLRLRCLNLDAEAVSYLAARSWPAVMSVASDNASIDTGTLKLELADGQLRIADASGVQRFAVELTSVAVRSVSLRILGEQHFYGLGQGGQPFDRLGIARRLWNNHVNHAQGGDIAIPLLLSHVGIGLFFDNASESAIDSGDAFDETWINYSCAGGALDFYVMGGNSLRETMCDVADLLGHAPLPPRWSLGFLQSTRHFDGPEELHGLLSEFRARQFPCDSVVLLSTYGDMLGWNRGVGFIDWEPRLVPDPKALLQYADRLGFKLILHEYPVIHAESPNFAEAEARGYVLESGFPLSEQAKRPSINYNEGQPHIDFLNAEAGGWWWDLHEKLVELGIAGWWLDGGEGPPELTPTSAGPGLLVHNRYDVARHQAFAEGEARSRAGRRVFLLCRSGGAGMQRYGAGCWSGDIDSSPGTLEAQIAVGLNVGLSGVPYWGTDIGGYYPSARPSPELFARWFQFGAFCPIFRAHGRTWRDHLPWSHGPEIEAICRAYAELRYRLVPYLNELAWQAHQQGLPLMRPLVMNYPGDKRTWDMGHQFLWGDDILVAPVTRLGARTWPVYLPEGRWIDFWTLAEYHGPIDIEIAAPLDRLPLFVRAGAIIPMGPVVQFLSNSTDTPLTLRIFPASRSAITLHDDDGETDSYRFGNSATTEIVCESSETRIAIRFEQRGGVRVTTHGAVGFEIFSRRQPRSIKSDGNELQNIPQGLADATGHSWSYDSASMVHIRMKCWPKELLLDFLD